MTYVGLDGELVDGAAPGRTVTSLTVAQLSAIIHAPTPIDRCIACRRVPPLLLAPLMPRKRAEAHRRVATKLDPALVARARATRAPFRLLLRVVSAPDQFARWDELAVP